jgi:hypothetical protein
MRGRGYNRGHILAFILGGATGYTPATDIMRNYFTQKMSDNLKQWRKIEKYIYDDLRSEQVKKYYYVIKLQYSSDTASRPDKIRIFACGKIDIGEYVGMWWVSTQDLWEQGIDQR